MLKLLCWKTMEQIEKEDIREVPDSNFGQYHEDLLIKELIDNNYVICGDTHQYLAIPIFTDGALILSMRRWGEIMSQAMNMRKGLELTGYRDFYLIALMSKNYKEGLPPINKNKISLDERGDYKL